MDDFLSYIELAVQHMLFPFSGPVARRFRAFLFRQNVTISCKVFDISRISDYIHIVPSTKSPGC
jgi:hypothetical protein